jgi:hypothetical protein
LAGAVGGVGVMVTGTPAPEAVVAWVRRSTTAQGLPEKVTDPSAVEGLVSLLRDGRDAVPARAARSE